MIASLDYNSRMPRFYNKVFARHKPMLYDVPLRIMAGGSGAAPFYFDPEIITNGYGYTESLVDGGIICNNPALYAYSIARNFKDKKKIRLVSLGTGRP